MKVSRQISDDEISFAIRYLDPDLNRGFGQVRRAFRKPKGGTAPAIVLLAVGIVLYILLLPWLPTLARLMR